MEVGRGGGGWQNFPKRAGVRIWEEHCSSKSIQRPGALLLSAGPQLQAGSEMAFLQPSSSSQCGRLREPRRPARSARSAAANGQGWIVHPALALLPGQRRMQQGAGRPAQSPVEEGREPGAGMLLTQLLRPPQDPESVSQDPRDHFSPILCREHQTSPLLGSRARGVKPTSIQEIPN